MKVKLTTISDVQDFVRKASYEYPYELYAKQGQYVVNAKSVMGILSLDLMNPFEIVNAHTEDEDRKCDNKARIFAKYIDTNDVGNLDYTTHFADDDSGRLYFTVESLDCDGVVGGGSNLKEALDEMKCNLANMVDYYQNATEV